MGTNRDKSVVYWGNQDTVYIDLTVFRETFLFSRAEV